MPFNTQLIEELNLLSRYNLNTTQEGIKIHSNASSETITAAERLFHKELISQADGGYLTSLGREAAEHAQNLLSIIK